MLTPVAGVKNLRKRAGRRGGIREKVFLSGKSWRRSAHKAGRGTTGPSPDKANDLKRSQTAKNLRRNQI